MTRPPNPNRLLMTSYIQYLLAVATESPDSWTAESRQLIRRSQSSDPAFLIILFSAIAKKNIPITREGTERLMDTLFENPAFAHLLFDPPIHQSHLASAIDLPSTSPAFQAFWTHIIIPAWEQHATIHQVMKESLNP